MGGTLAVKLAIEIHLEIVGDDDVSNESFSYIAL